MSLFWMPWAVAHGYLVLLWDQLTYTSLQPLCFQLMPESLCFLRRDLQSCTPLKEVHSSPTHGFYSVENMLTTFMPPHTLLFKMLLKQQRVKGQKPVCASKWKKKEEEMHCQDELKQSISLAQNKTFKTKKRRQEKTKTRREENKNTAAFLSSSWRGESNEWHFEAKVFPPVHVSPATRTKACETMTYESKDVWVGRMQWLLILTG